MKISFLLIASSFLFSSAVQAATADLSVDKKRAVQLTPKWSLPFQGQLQGIAPMAGPNSNQSVSSGTSGTNDLSLFKTQKYSVLTIAPAVVPNNELIASVIGPNDNSPVAVGKEGKLITGGVSAWDGPFDADRIINYLVDTHFENSPEGKKLDEQVKRQNNLTHKALAITKDSVNNMIEYQGIEPSMRAGRLICDSHDYKIRNNAWAEYERQKYIDQIHFQVVSSLMEIAEGIGNSETERGAKSISTGKESLTALVGEEESKRAVKALSQWLNNMPVAYANFAQTPWTSMERSKKLEEVLKAAVERDPVITKITARVYKYAHPSKTFQYSSVAIQTALDAITIFAPGIIPSVSAAALEMGYKISTGGTELNKVERELLMDKRIQSRLKVLSQESAMALDNYRYALVTKNPPLLAFSQEVIGNLSGRSTASKVVSAQSSYNANALVPELKESSDEKDHHRAVKIPLVN